MIITPIINNAIIIDRIVVATFASMPSKPNFPKIDTRAAAIADNSANKSHELIVKFLQSYSIIHENDSHV